MNRYSLNQSQLYALVLSAAIIPLIALVLGFHLAWQYHDKGSAKTNATFLPVVQSDELVMPNETLATLADLSLEAETQISQEKPLVQVSVKDEVSILGVPDMSSAQVSKAVLDEAFALQLGAFRDKSRAIAWASIKQLEHDNVHLLEREIGGQKYYAVAVGHFEKKDLAREAQKKLAESNGVSSYVIEYRKGAKEIVLSS